MDFRSGNVRQVRRPFSLERWLVEKGVARSAGDARVLLLFASFLCAYGIYVVTKPEPVSTRFEDIPAEIRERMSPEAVDFVLKREANGNF